MSPYLLAYLLAVNLIAFAAMGIDKRRAQRHRWRIPEATLMALALLGGSIGGMAGMYLFRHKTRHPLFFVGIPAIFVAEGALALWLFL